MRIGFLRSSDQCYNSIDHFMRCIEEALRRRGAETLRLLENEMTGPVDAIIAINDGLVSAKDDQDDKDIVRRERLIKRERR